jgi:hypothetical protein
MSKKQEPISKITRAKMAGGMAQAVECLLANTKTLSSNPSISKKQNKKKEFQRQVVEYVRKSQTDGYFIR